MAAASNARMAAGVLCGTPIMRGWDVVRVMTMPMAKAPNNMRPIPLPRNPLRLPEKIKAASETCRLIDTMVAMRPAVRLERMLRGWSSVFMSERFMGHLWLTDDDIISCVKRRVLYLAGARLFDCPSTSLRAMVQVEGSIRWLRVKSARRH